MIKVLVLGKPPQRLSDQLSLANEMGRHGSFQFHFLLSNRHLAEFRNQFEGTGVEVLPLYEDGAEEREKHLEARVGRSLLRHIKGRPALRRAAELVKEIVEPCTIYQYRQARRLLSESLKEYQAVRRVFSSIRPDVVLVPGDRHKEIEPSVLKVCREMAIPSIIPYFSYAGDETALQMRAGRRVFRKTAFSSLYARRVFKDYPDQVFQEHLFYSPSRTVALDRLGALSSNPWAMGGGLSDIVCVDSRHTYEQYLGKGVAEKKLRIVGDVAYDRLHESHANKEGVEEKIREKYGLDWGKKIIVAATDPLAEHNMSDWSAHWQEVDFLMSSLEKLEQNVLVSLHPRVDAPMYSFLEEKYCCKVLDERLSEVLPVADLYVSYLSSTVVWAVLCGISSVVTDFLNLNYSMFDFLKSPRFVKNREQFSVTLRKGLYGETDFVKDWQALSRDDVFAGNTVQKYVALISEVSRCG